MESAEAWRGSQEIIPVCGMEGCVRTGAVHQQGQELFRRGQRLSPANHTRDIQKCVSAWK